MELSIVHTSQRQISEMLKLAGRIIADTARKLPSTYLLLGVDLVVVGQRSVAAGHRGGVFRMEAI